MPRGVPKSGFRMTKKKMVSLSGVSVKSVEVVAESRFSINERFGFVSDMVCMLATTHLAQFLNQHIHVQRSYSLSTLQVTKALLNT